jgi:hypothetical protein
MQLETSTVNILLGFLLTGIAGTQAWIVRELLALRVAVATIRAGCVALHGKRVQE